MIQCKRTGESKGGCCQSNWQIDAIELDIEFDMVDQRPFTFQVVHSIQLRPPVVAKE